MTAHPPIILASASPRRAELLTRAGIPFQVVVSPAHEPERKPAGIPTDLWPTYLAYMKATAVQRHIPRKQRSRIILAADTIVVEGDRILNKANDRAHARRMLLSLRGKSHRVITGIALLSADRLRLTSATATVKVDRFSTAWLAAYLDSGHWRGKAGAYGIQDDLNSVFHCTAGDFSTVVGLPVPVVTRELASFRKDLRDA